MSCTDLLSICVRIQWNTELCMLTVVQQWDMPKWLNPEIIFWGKVSNSAGVQKAGYQLTHEVLAKVISEHLRACHEVGAPHLCFTDDSPPPACSEELVSHAVYPLLLNGRDRKPLRGISLVWIGYSNAISLQWLQKSTWSDYICNLDLC